MRTSGILLVDKPMGWTSFDVVNKIRRMCQEAGFNTTGRKRYLVGHTGTLDPRATGLLVILVGNYTKKAPELTKLDKTYYVHMTLGQVSSTGDAEGEITATSTIVPSKEQVIASMQQFVGDIMQTPPAFSAIKINGQRAYDLARKGKEVQLCPRPAHIEYINLLSYKYPLATFRVKVSSGTYIRSLVEDIGKDLNTGAYMSDLRRETVGQFDINDAVTMQDLKPDDLAELLIG